MVLELEHPITFASREIKALTFRDPRAKDMRKLRAKMSFGDLLDIGASLCAEPTKVMDLLHPTDARRVIDHVGKSLGNGKPISEGPLPS